MLIIITFTPSSPMTIVICVHIISILMIIVVVPTTSAGIGSDEWLENHPHPCRKSRHAGSEIGFERRPRRGILEKLGELVLDLIALAFTSLEIAQPMKRLDDAHCRSPGPEQLAGCGRTNGDRHVTELDRATTGVGVHHDFGRDGASQAQIVCRGHAVDKHPRLRSPGRSQNLHSC